jgi:hypothetical protein
MRGAGMGYWHFCQAMLLLALVRHPPATVMQVISHGFCHSFKDLFITVTSLNIVKILTEFSNCDSAQNFELNQFCVNLAF